MDNPYNNTFDAIRKQLLQDDEFCMELAKTFDDPWFGEVSLETPPSPITRRLWMDGMFDGINPFNEL